MGVVKAVVVGVKQGIKYAPIILPVMEKARGPATEYAKARLDASKQKRLALTKAATLRDGTVLSMLHGEQPVWVVFSGEEPVSSHPAVDVPLAELVRHADLARRRRPEEFPTPRERAAAARHAAVAKVRRRPNPAEGIPTNAGGGISETLERSDIPPPDVAGQT